MRKPIEPKPEHIARPTPPEERISVPPITSEVRTSYSYPNDILWSRDDFTDVAWVEIRAGYHESHIDLTVHFKDTIPNPDYDVELEHYNKVLVPKYEARKRKAEEKYDQKLAIYKEKMLAYNKYLKEKQAKEAALKREKELRLLERLRKKYDK